MSGLTIYLDDTSFNKMLENINAMSRKRTEIIHRDAFGIEERFLINKKQIEALGKNIPHNIELDRNTMIFLLSTVIRNLLILYVPDDQRWVEKI